MREEKVREEQQSYMRLQIIKRVTECQLPASHDETSFRSLDATKHPESFALCQQFAVDRSYEGKRGLLLLGNVGTGKTCLAVATLKRMLALGKGRRTGIYFNLVEGMDRVRKGFDEEDGLRVSDVLDHSVVLLDDFGAGKLTDWLQEQFYLLIDGLNHPKKNALITSNMTQQTFNNMDPRVRSRVLGLCHLVVVDGPDLRVI